MSFSKAEAEYCTTSIQNGLRLDGRGLTDFRPIEVEVGLIAQANGSARLRLGDTDVIVGVKAEVTAPSHDAPNSGRLTVTVECSPTASPEYEGRGGEAWGQQLADALEASLRPGPSGKGGLPLRPLCILPGKAAWSLYVDCLVLNDAGGVLGALSAATLAALTATRLPRVTVRGGKKGVPTNDDADEEEADAAAHAGGEDGEEGEGREAEIELDEDDEGEGVGLEGVGGVPLILTVGSVGKQLLVDMSLLEEQCAASTLHVTVTPAGTVCGMRQEGPAGLPPATLEAMAEAAGALGPRMLQALSAFGATTAAAHKR